ncbi:hypothetical protein GO755_00030 [Spirosoma sp. HMF4905]|uniref:Uncharacterized protein n=1 Tax=Spirosoma arboris TaxID=2682092 RepID=A0A7K1S3J4_9BACT|nr:hypothetical protein [Spirosoma arboris]MVM28399.1 hypothetical protein [Spirosoma arboris]
MAKKKHDKQVNSSELTETLEKLGQSAQNLTNLLMLGGNRALEIANDEIRIDEVGKEANQIIKIGAID